MKSGKGKATKTNIVKESLKLFSTKGYYNTSIRDIVLATGLTRGGLYGHFESKEEIWNAVYDEAVKIWKDIAFKGTMNISDPIERIEKMIKNITERYFGANIFEGGAFFVPMLFEVSGHSKSMSMKISKGFDGFSNLLYRWLKEGDQRRLLKKELNLREIANFIFISLNGAASLYIVNKDAKIWKQTNRQLHFYIKQLRK